MIPVIAAGEPELHAWCGACQSPARLRVPLHLGSTAGPVVSTLEICPGCGTGHDRPRVEVAAAPRERAPGSLSQRLARALHARACRRRGVRPAACAYADCQWPGLYRHEYSVPGEDGTWRYVFCRKAHRRRWLSLNGLKP